MLKLTHSRYKKPRNITIISSLVVLIGIGVAVGMWQAKLSSVAYAQAAKTTPLTASNSGLSTSKSNPSKSPQTKAATITKTTPSSAPAASTAPIAATATSAAAAVAPGAALFADPYSSLAQNALAWAASNPANAGVMQRLAATPTATWFGDWNGSNPQAAVAAYVGRASAAGKIPTLVAYNIPQRDCGSYSAGGAASAAAYQAWIDGFSAGIGQRQAIVIVEPDALAGMDCFSASDQQARTQLITYAVQKLKNQTKAAIYLDAGNSNWKSAAVMAARLKSADITEATGFSLNVSNFQTTSANTTYGSSLSSLVGGKHFVVDTSRNGNGPTSDNAWCNPDGRAFGNLPTLQTGAALVDAYLWIKAPGESDGTCGSAQFGAGAPGAGAWWPQYALMLAQNSHW